MRMHLQSRFSPYESQRNSRQTLYGFQEGIKTMASTMRHLDEKQELIQVLRKWIQVHGKIPTHREWENDPNTPSGTIIRQHFGSWKTWLRAAKI